MKKAGIVMLCVGMLLASACGSETGNQPSKVTIPPEIPKITEQVNKGKMLFQSNCAVCHNPLHNATGPALAGSFQRWQNDTTRLYAFIRNPQKAKEENQYVKALYEKYQSDMTPFPSLTNDDIRAILTYVDDYAKPHF